MIDSGGGVMYVVLDMDVHEELDKIEWRRYPFQMWVVEIAYNIGSLDHEVAPFHVFPYVEQWSLH